MPKNEIFPARNVSTATSFEAFMIVGALIVIWIIIYLLQLVAGFAFGSVAGLFGGGTVGLLAFGVFASLLGAIGYGLGGISVALIYARLREIKEGVGVDEIAAVFD